MRGRLSRMLGALAIVSIVGFLVGCKAQRAQEEDNVVVKKFQYYDKTLVEFIIDEELSNVLQEAELQKRPTFVEFYTTWCLPCEIMDETVFVNRPLSEYYNANFVSFKLDAEQREGMDFRFIFGVENFPTFLYLDANGRVLLRDEGSKTTTEMMLLGEEATKLYKSSQILPDKVE
jgi:thiol:disulfide interchange protein